jgi:hypothetical protein
MRQAIKKAMGLIIVVVAFAAISAPAATARVDIHPPSYSEEAQTAAPIPTTPASPPSSSAGFDWGDAAVGAGVALALTGLAGGVVLVSRRGRARPRPTTS